MKRLVAGLAALSFSATYAAAGGIDRAGLPYAILFQDGKVSELSFSNVTPNVSGTYPLALSGFGASTNNMTQSYTSLSFAFKGDISDKLAYAIIADQPYGADARYTGGAYTGLEAHWSSTELAALLRYRVTDRVSAYGGLRYVTSKANIAIPTALLGAAGAYSATAASDSKLGYVMGAAYEIPKIALRVGVTYQSAINHEFATTEAFAGIGPGPTNTTKITMPQSLAIDFQSGIAKDTLLFGSVRWVEWSKWHVDPAFYHGVTGQEVTGFDHDVITYELGVGRKISAAVSVFASLGYEAPNHTVASRLSPTDGRKSIGLGAVWTRDTMKITGGLQYVKLGNAVDGSGTVFKGNSAVGLGVKVDFSF